MTDVEKILEFDKIKEQLAGFAYTQGAKEMIWELTPYMSERELSSKLRETSEARFLIEKMGNPPMTSMNDIGVYIDIAKKGGCLSEEQLETVAITLTAIKRLKDYLHSSKQYDISIAYYEDNLDSVEEVRAQITEVIWNTRVVDGASKLLKSLRSSIEVSEQKMREKAEAILRNYRNCLSDSFSTVRNGHICIPVKKEYRYKIPGTVVDKSATGNTIFIEPESVGRYYEELNGLKMDEENETRRILYELSGMLADTATTMEQNSLTIEKLDFMFAKGKLSLELDCVEPIINTERRIVLTNGRHPLMDKAVNVPLQFELGNGVNGIVITGPNTGGKTVAIKTVALNSMMAQCGLHVACSAADICMNNAYLCDIGDGQNLSENLSTFSSHIVNVLAILRRATRDSLIIMDELGSGTDPTEGMGIAIAILEELKKSGALYLVTTHYPEVKNYAKRTQGVLNARMTFDKESLKPLYQLVIGEAGESCAFYIASRLGMPEEMLRMAMQSAYGNDDLAAAGLVPQHQTLQKESSVRIHKKKAVQSNAKAEAEFQVGDSVMVYPDKRIGIVCKKADEKGMVRVQLPDKKIYINHKRIKLQVAAAELYPEDYDFSIIFDTVANRKLSHQMERKYVKDISIHREE